MPARVEGFVGNAEITGRRPLSSPLGVHMFDREMSSPASCRGGRWYILTAGDQYGVSEAQPSL